MKPLWGLQCSVIWNQNACYWKFTFSYEMVIVIAGINVIKLTYQFYHVSEYKVLKVKDCILEAMQYFQALIIPTWSKQYLPSATRNTRTMSHNWKGKSNMNIKVYYMTFQFTPDEQISENKYILFTFSITFFDIS